MSNWLLNTLFKTTSTYQRVSWRTYMGRHMGLQGAQTQLV